jgi:hypothetical protein
MHLMPLLETLGLRLIAVEDPELVARTLARRTPRQTSHVHGPRLLPAPIDNADANRGNSNLSQKEIRMVRLASILLELCISTAALAQQTPSTSPQMPFDFPATVGTSSAMVVGQNLSRRRIEFYNPSAPATVAVCPTISRATAAAITCTVNGAGSITLLPYGSVRIDGTPGNASVPS